MRVRRDARHPVQRVNIFGLPSNIYSLEQPAYPLFYPDMYVFSRSRKGAGRARVKSSVFSLPLETGPTAAEPELGLWRRP